MRSRRGALLIVAISAALGATSSAEETADPGCAAEEFIAGRFRETIPAARKALAAFSADQRTSEPYARCLLRLGSSLHEVGSLGPAEVALMQARTALEAGPASSAGDLADALDMQGRLSLSFGEVEGARKAFERSLALRRQAGATKADLAGGAGGLARVDRALGRTAAAEAHLTQAIVLRQALPRPDARDAEMRSLLGSLQLALGDLGAAKRSLEQADTLWRALGLATHPGRASALNVRGVLHLTLDQPELARSLLEEALRIQSAALGDDAPAPLVTMENLLAAHVARQDLARARKLGERVFWAHRKLGPDQSTWFLTNGTFAGVPSPLLPAYAGLNKALRHTKSMTERVEQTLGHRNPLSARLQAHLGFLYEADGRYEEAERHYVLALATEDTLDQPGQRSAISWRYARYVHGRGDTETAIFYGKRAVNDLQMLGRSIGTGDLVAQSSFDSSNRAIHEELATWLIDAGRIPEALEIIDLIKREELSHFIRRRSSPSLEDSGREVSFTPTEKKLAERSESLSGHITALGREYDRYRVRKRLAANGGPSLSDADEKHLAEVRSELARAHTRFVEVLGTIRTELRASGRTQQLESRNLGSLRTLQNTLRRLAPGTVLVHYMMGRDRLHVILTTSATQIVRSVPITSERLNRVVFRALAAMRDVSRDPRGPAGELHRIVIGPIQDDLRQAEAATLMLSLDGTLRYVPWAALYDAKRQRYLVEDFSFAIYSERSRNLLERRPGSAPRAAALGVRRKLQGFPALVAVASEVEAIVRTGPLDTDGVFDGVIYLDEQFNHDTFVGVLEAGFPIIHIASHFVFQPGTARDSYLVLGDGSRLSLAQISAENLPFDDVELITLSACDTARGDASDGREIDGFGAVVLGQGAASVLASLWKVNDRSTSELMREFYTGWSRRGETNKATALRNAQLTMLLPADGAGGFRTHPYFWAPFVIMGNWL